jgi:hypothetical protein
MSNYLERRSPVVDLLECPLDSGGFLPVDGGVDGYVLPTAKSHMNDRLVASRSSYSAISPRLQLSREGKWQRENRAEVKRQSTLFRTADRRPFVGWNELPACPLWSQALNDNGELDAIARRQDRIR